VSTRKFLRQVGNPAQSLENIQLTISIQADKGLLGPSSVVRIRLRMPSRKNAEDAAAGAPQPEIDEHIELSQLATDSDALDESFEFPSETSAEDEATVAAPTVDRTAPLQPHPEVTPAAASRERAAAPRNGLIPRGTFRIGVLRVVGILGAFMIVAFACGVLVGTWSMATGTVVPMVLRVPAAADSPGRIEAVSVVAAMRSQRANTVPVLRTAAAAPVRPVAASYRSSLRVESTPGGAIVYLNNQPAGTTPLSLDGIPVGSRVVRLELPGYERWSSAITIISNEAARVRAELHPVANAPSVGPRDADQAAQ
jgi:hypothetical protein